MSVHQMLVAAGLDRDRVWSIMNRLTAPAPLVISAQPKRKHRLDGVEPPLSKLKLLARYRDACLVEILSRGEVFTVAEVSRRMACDPRFTRSVITRAIKAKTAFRECFGNYMLLSKQPVRLEQIPLGVGAIFVFGGKLMVHPEVRNAILNGIEKRPLGPSKLHNLMKQSYATLIAAGVLLQSEGLITISKNSSGFIVFTRTAKQAS